MAEVTLTPYTVGTVFDQRGLLIDALPVRHSTETYALRFRAGGRSIVHSADTAYHEPLIEFARGADLLIHSAMAVTAIREHWGRRARCTCTSNYRTFTQTTAAPLTAWPRSR